ncbi:hypothetical protein DFH06DRAFT_576419 [Mycena polygramma]|nr:hypothetical protein DFH06DRAFT_576419 [Mycena polygramma]
MRHLDSVFFQLRFMLKISLLWTRMRWLRTTQDSLRFLTSFRAFRTGRPPSNVLLRNLQPSPCSQPCLHSPSLGPPPLPARIYPVLTALIQSHASDSGRTHTLLWPLGYLLISLQSKRIYPCFGPRPARSSISVHHALLPIVFHHLSRLYSPLVVFRAIVLQRYCVSVCNSLLWLCISSDSLLLSISPQPLVPPPAYPELAVHHLLHYTGCESNHLLFIYFRDARIPSHPPPPNSIRLAAGSTKKSPSTLDGAYFILRALRCTLVSRTCLTYRPNADWKRDLFHSITTRCAPAGKELTPRTSALRPGQLRREHKPVVISFHFSGTHLIMRFSAQTTRKSVCGTQGGNVGTEDEWTHDDDSEFDGCLIWTQ